MILIALNWRFRKLPGKRLTYEHLIGNRTRRSSKAAERKQAKSRLVLVGFRFFLFCLDFLNGLGTALLGTDNTAFNAFTNHVFASGPSFTSVWRITSQSSHESMPKLRHYLLESFPQCSA